MNHREPPHSQPPLPPAGGAAQVAADLLRLAAGLGQAAQAGSGPVGVLLAQAQWAASAALMRGWQRGAQAWAEQAPGLLSAASARGAAAADPAHAGQQLDEARGLVRRLGEIACDEAAQLVHELHRIDEQLRATAAPADLARRQARAKD